MGAHACAQGEKQRHESQSADIARDIEIAIVNTVGGSLFSNPPQIHQQKGEIVEHVDAGQVVVEFQAIEQNRIALEQADIAQMQVAVTVPQPACLRARVEPASLAFERRPAIGKKRHRSLILRQQGICKPLFIGFLGVSQCGAAGLVLPHFGMCVKRRNMRRQRVQHLRFERAAIGEPIEQQLLFEASHFDNRVYRFASIGESETAILVAHYFADSAIDLRRSPSIEGVFSLAIMQSQRRRRESRYGSRTAFFSLKTRSLYRKNDRNMRFDPLRRRLSWRNQARQECANL